MRIERVQASPHKKGRVLVFLEDGACLKITEQEALDFGLIDKIILPKKSS